MEKKDGKLEKLIDSIKVELINKRFRAQVSVFNNGVDKKSNMLVIHDLLENHFKIHFYDSINEIITILKILREVSK